MPRRTMKEFRQERAAGQKMVMDCDHLGIKRFFRLDAASYEDGALPGRTKELLGWLQAACCAATTASTTTWSRR